MYIEKRKSGKGIKYYLVYSYRENGNVEKIRRYLGSNLSETELNKNKENAEKVIRDLIRELRTDVFFFELTKSQIESLNKYDNKIQVAHLKKEEWLNFTEEFVYNTNAIEGSTVNLEEVKDIIEGEKKPLGDEEIESKNVANAIEYIRQTKEDLSLNLILKLHEICFKKTKPFAGKFREVNVVITNFSGEIIHSGVPKEKLKDYLKEFIEWYEKSHSKFKPLVLASIIHNQFEHIHPFQDGNGRVGRLLLNFILLKNNYPPINILLKDRTEYYKTLQEYSKNHKLKPTLEFLIKQYKKTLKQVPIKKK